MCFQLFQLTLFYGNMYVGVLRIASFYPYKRLTKALVFYFRFQKFQEDKKTIVFYMIDVLSRLCLKCTQNIGIYLGYLLYE